MKTIDPGETEPRFFYKYMTSSVAPRPIALVSSMDAAGRINLSPFSFFNFVGIDPPILVFAPNKRAADKTNKHTALNAYEVPEVTINLVTHAMVHQISLASAEFERGVNEFEKSGLTPLPSVKVAPPRVKESPAQFECKVIDIREHGSMVLIICEVVMAHFDTDILDENGLIDQRKTDWIARLGGDWYARATGDALFEVPRPQVGIGVDALPAAIRNSNILTGNDLGRLGSVKAFPSADDVATFSTNPEIQRIIDEARYGCQYLPDLLHLQAHRLLAEGNVTEAWLTLMQSEISA
jgi:flavin reductase (DIM6/NTAB) family NADH-FMN oxidoreductase RutF